LYENFNKFESTFISFGNSKLYLGLKILSKILILQNVEN
jgi:hypothetical protein